MPEIITPRVDKLLEAGLIVTGAQLQSELAKDIKLAEKAKDITPPADQTPPPDRALPPDQAPPADQTAPADQATPQQPELEKGFAKFQQIRFGFDSSKSLEFIYELNPKAKTDIIEFINTVSGLSETLSPWEIEPDLIASERGETARSLKLREFKKGNLFVVGELVKPVLTELVMPPKDEIAWTLPLSRLPTIGYRDRVIDTDTSFLTKLRDVGQYGLETAGSVVNDFAENVELIVDFIGSVFTAGVNAVIHPIETSKQAPSFFKNLAVSLFWDSPQAWFHRYLVPFGTDPLGAADNIIKHPFSFLLENPIVLPTASLTLGASMARATIRTGKVVRIITKEARLAKEARTPYFRLRQLTQTPRLDRAIDKLRMASEVTIYPFTWTLGKGVQGAMRALNGVPLLPYHRNILPKAFTPAEFRRSSKALGELIRDDVKILFGKDDVPRLAELNAQGLQPLFYWNHDINSVFKVTTKTGDYGSQGIIGINIGSLSKVFEKVTGQTLKGRELIRDVLFQDKLLKSFTSTLVQAAADAHKQANEVFPNANKVIRNVLKSTHTVEELMDILDGINPIPPNLQSTFLPLQKFFRQSIISDAVSTSLESGGRLGRIHKEFLGYIRTLQRSDEVRRTIRQRLSRYNVKVAVPIQEILPSIPNPSEVESLLAEIGIRGLQGGGGGKVAVSEVREYILEQLGKVFLGEADEGSKLVGAEGIPSGLRQKLANALGVESEDIGLFEYKIGEQTHKAAIVKVLPDIAGRDARAGTYSISTSRFGKKIAKFVFRPNDYLLRATPFKVNIRDIPKNKRLTTLAELKEGDSIYVVTKGLDKKTRGKRKGITEIEAKKVQDGVRYVGRIEKISDVVTETGTQKIYQLKVIDGQNVKRGAVSKSRKNTFNLTESNLQQFDVFKPLPLEERIATVYNVREALYGGLEVGTRGINTEVSLADYLLFEAKKFHLERGTEPLFITDDVLLSFEQIQKTHNAMLSKLYGAGITDDTLLYKNFKDVVVGMYNDFVTNTRIQSTLQLTQQRYGIIYLEGIVPEQALAELNRTAAEHRTGVVYKRLTEGFEGLFEEGADAIIEANPEVLNELEVAIRKRLISDDTLQGKVKYVVTETDLGSLRSPDVSTARSVVRRLITPFQFKEFEALLKFWSAQKDSFLGIILKNSLGGEEYRQLIKNFRKSFTGSVEEFQKTLTQIQGKVGGRIKDIAPDIISGNHPQIFLPTDIAARLAQTIIPAPTAFRLLKQTMHFLIPSLMIWSFGFHVNNLLGGIVLSAMSGISLPDIIAYWARGGRSYIPAGLLGQDASYFASTKIDVPSSGITKWAKTAHQALKGVSVAIENVINPYMAYSVAETADAYLNVQRVKEATSKMADGMAIIPEMTKVGDDLALAIANAPTEEAAAVNKIHELNKQLMQLEEDTLFGVDTIWNKTDVDTSLFSSVANIAVDKFWGAADKIEIGLNNIRTMVSESSVSSKLKTQLKELTRTLKDRLDAIVDPYRELLGIRRSEGGRMSKPPTVRNEGDVAYQDLGRLKHTPYIVQRHARVAREWHELVKPAKLDTKRSYFDSSAKSKQSMLGSLRSDLLSLRSQLDFVTKTALAVRKGNSSIAFRARSLRGFYDDLLAKIEGYRKDIDLLFRDITLTVDTKDALFKRIKGTESQIDDSMLRLTNVIFPMQMRLTADSIRNHLWGNLNKDLAATTTSLNKLGKHLEAVISFGRGGDVFIIDKALKAITGDVHNHFLELKKLSDRVSLSITSTMDKMRIELPKSYRDYQTKVAEIMNAKNTELAKIGRLRPLMEKYDGLVSKYFSVASQYAALSPFERNIISAGIPFWGFYKTAAQNFLRIRELAPHYLALSWYWGTMFNYNETLRQFGIDGEHKMVLGIDKATGRFVSLNTRGLSPYTSFPHLLNALKLTADAAIKIPYYLIGGRIDPDYVNFLSRMEEGTRKQYEEILKDDSFWDVFGRLGESLQETGKGLGFLLPLQILGLVGDGDNATGYYGSSPESIVDVIRGRELQTKFKDGRLSLEERHSLFPSISSMIRRIAPQIRKLEDVIYPILKQPNRPLFFRDPYLVQGLEVPIDQTQAWLNFFGVPLQISNIYQTWLINEARIARLISYTTMKEKITADPQAKRYLQMIKDHLRTREVIPLRER